MDSLIKKDYSSAEKYFKRLNKISENNLYFESFFGNILISWVKALENNEEDSFKFYNKIPERYDSLKKIQNSFLQCYFDKSETEITFKQLISNKETGFTRYNFFLANYFLHQNETERAELLIRNALYFV